MEEKNKDPKDPVDEDEAIKERKKVDKLVEDITLKLNDIE